MNLLRDIKDFNLWTCIPFVFLRSVVYCFFCYYFALGFLSFFFSFFAMTYFCESLVMLPGWTKS